MNKVRATTIISHLLILEHKYVNCTHQTSLMHKIVTQKIPLHYHALRVEEKTACLLGAEHWSDRRINLNASVWESERLVSDSN